MAAHLNLNSLLCSEIFERFWRNSLDWITEVKMQLSPAKKKL
jgi:hypothetical protein